MNYAKEQLRKQRACCSVIGLGYGDEGKGATIHSLTFGLSSSDTIVVRYNGGQQAGHTVYKNEKEYHVFSSFGSGSFNGIPTYISKYCTIDPAAILREQDVLMSKGINPTLMIDKRCPVTTPYDIRVSRRAHSRYISDGTVGVGVGTTIQREEDGYSLLAGDLRFPEVVKIKLEMIRKYHGIDDSESYSDLCHDLLHVYRCLLDNFRIVEDIPKDYDSYYFEGSQGLLLDQNTGFFPHVTRSNTGTNNIVEMGFTPHLYLVTRAYQTRHGNGPLTNESNNIVVIPDNPYETNKSHPYQGKFRKSILDISVLKYAMSRDEYISRCDMSSKTLVITCLDVLNGSYCFTNEGKTHMFTDEKQFVRAVGELLDVGEVITTKKPWNVEKTDHKIKIC